MSPRRASAATKSGSFAASPSWKRVFSRQRMSPRFIAATACSATSPFCIGTLRSTRKSTRLPLTSASSRVRKAFMNALTTRTDARAKSGELAHRHRGGDHAIGEAPFVVVPRHHPHQGAVDHLGLVHVKDGRMRIVVEVGGDIGRVGVAEDAL